MKSLFGAKAFGSDVQGYGWRPGSKANGAGDLDLGDVGPVAVRDRVDREGRKRLHAGLDPAGEREARHPLDRARDVAEPDRHSGDALDPDAAGLDLEVGLGRLEQMTGDLQRLGAHLARRGVDRAAGCDRLTISPQLLEELDKAEGKLERRLSPETTSRVAPIKVDEKTFRWMLNEDAMATEKLAEGIRRFDADARKLEKLLTSLAAAVPAK